MFGAPLNVTQYVIGPDDNKFGQSTGCATKPTKVIRARGQNSRSSLCAWRLVTVAYSSERTPLRPKTRPIRFSNGAMLVLPSRAQGTVMLIQFLVGGLVSVCNIAIHALVMTVVVRVARASIATTTHPSLLLMTTMIATVSVLMSAHVVEVFVWSLAYAMVGAVPAEGGLVYFAFVSYATLGYGDVLPVQRWQLLGPMAAMNGALLFGWSTAVIFEVLQRTMTIGFNTAATK
jgi:hypothetical protein